MAITEDEIQKLRKHVDPLDDCWCTYAAEWGELLDEVERLRAENAAAKTVNAELYKIEDDYKAKLAKARAALEHYAMVKDVNRVSALYAYGERARQALKDTEP